MSELKKPESHYVCITRDGYTLEFEGYCNQIILNEETRIVWFRNKVFDDGDERYVTLGMIPLQNVSSIYLTEKETVVTDLKESTDLINNLLL